jgi:hypothetical protein
MVEIQPTYHNQHYPQHKWDESLTTKHLDDEENALKTFTF